MPDFVKGKATICIINYKTLDFTRLCLRSIRKFTNYPYEVIVVDNNSQDESLEYLKSLKWIRLIEHPPESGELRGSYAEGSALDLGLENCNTEFFISMHSDTFVQKENWLGELIGYFNNDETIACVGSDKIELIPPPFCFAKAMQRGRILLKKATDFRTFKHKILREPDPLGKFRYHNRTICCLYRTEILRREELSFLMDHNKGLTDGKKLYLELVDRGYGTVELPPATMGRYVIHLAHATQVVNPQEFTLRKRTIKKCNRIIDKVMSSAIMQNIVTDDSLDR